MDDSKAHLCPVAVTENCNKPLQLASNISLRHISLDEISAILNFPLNVIAIPDLLYFYSYQHVYLWQFIYGGQWQVYLCFCLYQVSKRRKFSLNATQPLQTHLYKFTTFDKKESFYIMIHERGDRII